MIVSGHTHFGGRNGETAALLASLRDQVPALHAAEMTAALVLQSALK